MAKSLWNFREGSTMGRFTVGHRALMSGNPNSAFIIGLRRVGAEVRVLLHFLTPQPVEGSVGEPSERFDVSHIKIGSTWGPAATVFPYRRPGRPRVHGFGSAHVVVPKGYSFWREVYGTPDAVQQHFDGHPVVLVKSAELQGRPGEFAIGVFDWKPRYERWRHGGWYVGGIYYPNGGCGCVSNNYPDKKWRIACDPRRFDLNEPGDFTFPTRDAAARAELELLLSL